MCDECGIGVLLPLPRQCRMISTLRVTVRVRRWRLRTHTRSGWRGWLAALPPRPLLLAAFCPLPAVEVWPDLAVPTHVRQQQQRA